MSDRDAQNSLQNVLHSEEASDLAAKLGGQFISGTTNATPDTEDAFTHSLGRIPKGFLVVSKDKAGDIYDGGTANTTTALNLKCSVASVAFKIYVF